MNSRVIPQLIRASARHTGVMSQRSFVSVTSPLLEKKTINVPTMGDSITEGTIVEWVAQPGQLVNEGDVVALVETDKVTVDIKSDMTGVLTQQFGAVDDTVEVGSKLYELDTDAEPTVEASAAAPAAASSPEPTPAAAAPAPAKAAPAKAAAPAATSHRVPSIKFLGKEGWYRVLNGIPEFPPVPTNYGRPEFSEDEMEALLTGGANLVPEVKAHSSGAVFGF